MSVCHCETCRPITITDMRMVLCPLCGNKRCPHATNHVHACTGSNEVGQVGSSWEHVAPLPALAGVAGRGRKTAPDEIYLQGYVDSVRDSDVTWSDHPTRNGDTRYLRAPASGVEPVPCPACESRDVGGGSGIVHCYVCKLEVKRETTALAAPAWNERAPLIKDKLRLDSGRIMTHERDEFGDEYQCDRRGIDLRAGIDAAIEAAKDEPKREPRRFASQFTDRFLYASTIDLWIVLEKLAPSGGAWRVSKESLSYSWQEDPRLAGITLDAIQAALP